MLKINTHHRCDCCGDQFPKRVYAWGGYGYWYCLTCLHSIGVNAAGNLCTRKQYREAWEAINGTTYGGPITQTTYETVRSA